MHTLNFRLELSSLNSAILNSLEASEITYVRSSPIMLFAGEPEHDKGEKGDGQCGCVC